jgi:3-isopropylmalate dehydrogenase
VSPSGSPVSATIAVLPGDGVGTEVTAAARVVLEAVASRYGHHFTFAEALIGGVAIDVTGSPLPDETVALCRSADAVLLGAVGGPRWDGPDQRVRPEQGLLGIRKALGVFANLRPVVTSPVLAPASPFRPEHIAGVDLVVVRELTGGIYFGEKKLIGAGDTATATDVCSYSTAEIERIVVVAAELARSRRARLVSVDKANVLETSRLWRRVATRVISEAYPDLTFEHMLVDTAAMRLVQRPRDFDVIVTENMFGDILTDEASVLAGSIGLLPSASLGAYEAGRGRRGLYEPIHGSAPDIAGKGIANPIGAILSAAMLLRWSLGLAAEALAVERAVQATIDARVLTPDLGAAATRGVGTVDVTASVVSHLVSVDALAHAGA